MTPRLVFRDIFGAIIELEATVLESGVPEALVLRYGNFYGPGTRFASDGSDAELVRGGHFPIAGEGCGHWSFIQVHDAAAATVQAIRRGAPGVYNIVDDEPAPVSDWLPVYAQALGAPPPPRTGPPRSEFGAYGMLHQRGASNARRGRVSAGARGSPPGARAFATGSADDCRYTATWRPRTTSSARHEGPGPCRLRPTRRVRRAESTRQREQRPRRAPGAPTHPRIERRPAEPDPPMERCRGRRAHRD